MQIRASDINFWGRSFQEMQLRHETKVYPPRVKLTISSRNVNDTAVCVLPVKFVGCSSDSQLDVQLTIPLGKLITVLKVVMISGSPHCCHN